MWLREPLLVVERTVALTCPSLIVLSMVRTEELVVLRRKTQTGGRWNRAVATRPMVCSALGGEPKGDRENPESNGLSYAEIATIPRHRRDITLRARALLTPIPAPQSKRVSTFRADASSPPAPSYCVYKSRSGSRRAPSERAACAPLP